MADPVSSVAYAIEAALRALDGEPDSLVATMALVVATIAVVSATYHQLIGRFPRGGGGPRGDRGGVRRGLGVRAARRAARRLHPDGGGQLRRRRGGADRLRARRRGSGACRSRSASRRSVALGVLVGHRGRIGFAIATQGFLLLALVVIVEGAFADPAAGPAAASVRDRP